jgi:uncharacterized membrane protein YgdD (TMEM256/DUF423 family)
MLSAVARHGGSAPYLETAAQFLLFHAPALIGAAALLAIGILRHRLVVLAGSALALGLLLFCGDLAVRDLFGRPLFPMAAPIGGTVLLAGWLLLGAAGLWPGRRRD